MDLQLGHYDVHFQLEWREIILTCTNVSKKNKGNKEDAEFEDSLEGKKQQVLDAGLDVKVVSEYVTNRTSHVVGKKRNTAISLQALVQGKWVVGYGFLDALTKTARKEDKNVILPLEFDFNAHWPHEQDYIIEAGANELQPRPNHYLLPKPERAEVFQGYTFIFLSQSQYDQLRPVVTAGGGTALLFVVTLGQTKVDEVVNYIREVAGTKNNRNFKLSQHDRRSGIVVVRLNEHGRNEFAEKLDLALDQRGLEQNRLLDVILTLDTSELRKELPELSQSQEQDDVEAPQYKPSPTQRESSLPIKIFQEPVNDEEVKSRAHSEPDDKEQASEQHSGLSQLTDIKRWRRAPGKSRFKGFGEFKPSQFTQAPFDSPETSAGPRIIEPNQADSRQSMEADYTAYTSDPAGKPQHQSIRKRPAEPAEVKDANIFDSILPGQAALKRRKIVAANAGASAFPLSATGAANKAVRKEQRETQMDVKAELKARREAEEERRKRDEEALRQMTETDVSKLRHLAKVEEFELPVRELSDARRAGENGSRSERWDPKWNGRKNFKKFRPQGLRQDDGVAKSRLQRVIVTLEEVPRKGHGLGDEYWLRTSPTAGRGEDVQGKRAGGNHGKRNQVQAETQYENGNAASSEAFQRTLQRSREQDAEAAAAAQAFDNIEIAGTARDEIHRTSEAVAPQGILAEALVLDSQRIKTKPAGKRPAVSMSQPYFEGPLGKKARRGMTKSTARNLMDREEEDDGEELKFRRRRR